MGDNPNTINKRKPSRVTRKPATAPPPHSPTPQTPDMSSRTSKRHPPVGDRDKTILALCEARRCELGISKRQAGKNAEVDPSDAVKALSLKSATPRTVLALARYFEIGGIENANRAIQIEALLVEMCAHTERNAALLGKLAELAAASEPPLGG